MSIPLPVVILGVITGLTYGMLGVGLVLIYRTSRIINFAHGDVGALAASVLGVYVFRNHVPYWLLFPGALAIGAGANMLVEVVAVRRLRRAPAAMTILATLGFAAVYNVLQLVINTAVHTGSAYPQPPDLPSVRIGALTITPAYFAELIGTPLIVLALVLFLRRSRFGIAIRASADNRENATMRGIAPGRMSLLAWGIAGLLAAFTAIMQSPSQGFTVVGQSLGPGLLVRALVISVVARMDNLPVTLVAGVVLGVIEQVLLWNFPSGGQVEAVIFVIMMVALLLQSRQGTRTAEQGSWLAVRAQQPLPAAVARLWTVRNLDRFAVGTLIGAFLLLGTTSNRAAFIMTGVFGFAIIGLSVYVVTGLGGQLSLGQFALAGISAVLSYHITSDGVNFAVAVALAAVYTAVASLAIGLPALRIRGLMLTASTLAFAVMTESWLFNQPWGFGDGVFPKQPGLPGVGTLVTSRAYLLVVIPVVLVALWLTHNVNHGALRRALVAVRDNEDGARAFTVRATRVKLQAFAISGFLAGLGGAMFGHAQPHLSVSQFPAADGIVVVAAAAIGGISSMTGSFLGAFYLIGLSQFIQYGSAGLATSSIGWLLLILYFPGGLAQLLQPVRRWVIARLARLHGVDDVEAASSLVTPEADTATLTAAAVPKQRPTTASTPILAVDGVAKRYGGIVAVEDVTFTVARGEIFGLIGPNGAGKTTLFEMLSGFTRPDSGRVTFAGRDVTRLSPEARAEHGLVRSFQDARLFPTVTVLDAVTLAFERTTPTPLAATLLGLPTAGRAERRRTAAARELIGSMGLSAFQVKTIAELSTGTRRITELACLVAMQPRLLLLDEPSSGIAQRETEALGELIRTLKNYLDATVLVIEHDMPLITSLADRILAMEAGTVITVGPPTAVVTDPRVIDSYLGGDIVAIERSGALASA